jgi:HPt (histidine-containing phosphotransfer) domain-containing protein
MSMNPTSPKSKEQWLAEMADALELKAHEVIEVAAMFFEAVDERLDKLADAHQAGDLNVLCRLAHGLKGDAANMRFHHSSQLARELEMQCRAGQVHDFDGHLRGLRQALAQQKRTLGIGD